MLSARAAEGLGRPGQDFQLADHVSARLARPDDVTVSFGWLDAIVDGLLPCPMFGMQARIDDEPARAKQLGRQLSEMPLGIALIPT